MQAHVKLNTIIMHGMLMTCEAVAFNEIKLGCRCQQGESKSVRNECKEVSCKGLTNRFVTKVCPLLTPSLSCETVRSP